MKINPNAQRISKALDLADRQKRTAAYAGVAMAITAHFFHNGYPDNPTTEVTVMDAIEEFVFEINEVTVAELSSLKTVIGSFRNYYKRKAATPPKVLAAANLYNAFNITDSLGSGLVTIVDANIDIFNRAYNATMAFISESK